MTIREEYEDLKYELIASLEDANVVSILDCPFDYVIPHEMDVNFFKRGSFLRLQTKKALIMLENSYQKSRLFPGDDTAKLFEETIEQILTDFRSAAMKSYMDDPFYFSDFTSDEFSDNVETFIAGIREASKFYIEKVRTTTQREIELEVKARDNYRKMNSQTHFELPKQGPVRQVRRRR